MFKNIVIVKFLLLYTFGLHFCLQVILERAKLTYSKDTYVANGSLRVRRYGRKSPYYLSMEGITKQPWGNNVTVNIVFNEFLHNEYRRSFIESHFKLCDFLNNEPYIGGMILARIAKGLKCPFPPGEYHLMNMTVNTDSFPNVFPFEKGRLDVDVVVGTTGETMFRAYVDCIFKNTPRKTPK